MPESVIGWRTSGQVAIWRLGAVRAQGHDLAVLAGDRTFLRIY
jgi:hypothetical protein